jgi:hypothetical protein
LLTTHGITSFREDEPIAEEDTSETGALLRSVMMRASDSPIKGAQFLTYYKKSGGGSVLIRGSSKSAISSGVGAWNTSAHWDNASRFIGGASRPGR